jgi:universal stress protein A
MKTNTITEAARRPLTENNTPSARILPARQDGPIYRRILVGTDFSPASEPALEEAINLAKQNRAELLIAHATELPNTLGFLPQESYDRWVTDSRAAAEEQIRVLIEKARKEGVHCHALILIGLPDTIIIDAAQRLHVDLIVIGTHGRRGISRLFMGSVASRVVSHARCSTLTVRSPAPKSRLN